MLDLSGEGYKNIIDSMGEAVWIGDENEKTVYANKVFLDIVGYSLDEIIGFESYIFRDNESSKIVKENNLLRKKGEKSNYFGYLKSREGLLVPVYTSGTPIPGGGTVGIMTDLRPLNEAMDKVNHLNLQINNILEIILLDENKNILENNSYSILDLAGFIQGVIDKYKDKTKIKNINTYIEIENQIELQKILIDKIRLIEVFENIYNILINFSKPEGGDIFFKINSLNDGYLFEIIDDGLGFPIDLLEKSFSKFENIKQIKEGKFDGVGFGLYISKRILEIMGTKLNIKSKIGIGTSISFKIKKDGF